MNLAYCWFCKLGIEDAIPDHSAFSRARNERYREGDVFRPGVVSIQVRDPNETKRAIEAIIAFLDNKPDPVSRRDE